MIVETGKFLGGKDPVLDGLGVSRFGIFFHDLILNVHASELPGLVEQLGTPIREERGGTVWHGLSDRADEIKPGECLAESVDGDFVHEQCAIQDIVVPTDRSDRIEGDHDGAAVHGSLPKCLVGREHLVGRI